MKRFAIIFTVFSLILSQFASFQVVSAQEQTLTNEVANPLPESSQRNTAETATGIASAVDTSIPNTTSSPVVQPAKESEPDTSLTPTKITSAVAPPVDVVSELSQVPVTSNIMPVSPELYITEIQVQTKEFIEIYNPMSVPASLKGITVSYRGGGTKETILKQFAPDSGEVILAGGFYVLSHGYVVPSGVPSAAFTADLNNSYGYLRLYSSAKDIDIVGWGKSAGDAYGASALVPSTDASIQRCFLDGKLEIVEPRNNSQEFKVYSETTPGDGIQCQAAEVPTPSSLCKNDVIISEIFSDAAGLESNGGEFVELYNPGEEASLFGCKITSSKSSAELITFTETDKISAGGYYVISLKDKLTNVSGSVTLTASDRSEVVQYDGVHEGQSYARFTTGWQLTDKPTLGSANELVILSEEEVVAIGKGDGILTACSPGKYRNPETGRCRNIEAVTTAVPCDVGEYRNPETGRCRKVAAAASSVLTPCGPGEERNLLTNRCRKITTATPTQIPCQPGYERNPETNRCRKVSGAAPNSKLAPATNSAAINPMSLSPYVIAILSMATLGYGAFEYRSDAIGFVEKVKAKFSKTK